MLMDMLTECYIMFLDMTEKDYPTDLTDCLWELIMSIRKYNDSQPRDDHGRWTDGGGSSNSSGAIQLRINLFDRNDPLYVQSFSIEEEKGFEDICAHGSPESIEVRLNGKKVNMDAQQFAGYLKSQNKNGDFRLASCSTGKGDNSFAQQLSHIMQNKIMAPDDDVYYIPDEGVLRIGSPHISMGSWRIFDKGVEIS